MSHDLPPFIDVWGSLHGDRLNKALALCNDARIRQLNWPYRPWRKVRPIARQHGIEPELAWGALKLLRSAAWKELGLKQPNGVGFGLSQLPAFIEQLHRIDQSLGGGPPASLGASEGLFADVETQRRLVVRSLMDESVDSSLIEGAVTTRKRAVELLRSGGEPKDKSEKMVVNNYRAMQWVKERLQQPLSVAMLLELQSIVTLGTLDDPAGVGRLRTPSDDIAVVDKRTGQDVYVPPTAGALPGRLKLLCEFANHRHSGDDFLHPIVKACVLHFMIGYEHPFVDGNGRTARAVFYWAALRAGYRIFEFLVVSELILKAFAQYPQAYLDSEHDGGDLTYFVSYKLGVVERSIARFQEHLAREGSRVQRALTTVKRFRDLNLRQRLLLEHALRHPSDEYSPRSYASTNAITLPTARADLQTLACLRLLSPFKVGKSTHYVPAPNLAKKLG